MSHIPDMKALDGRAVAVGWLHPEHPYPRGAAPVEFVARLALFARNWGESIDALGWGAAGGFHECEFCSKPWASRRFGDDVASGTFGVPAGERIYFCPEMILHYVTEHGYLPPAEFVAAVMACPVPGTAEYDAVAEPFANRFE
jgi:hypothetical protein